MSDRDWMNRHVDPNGPLWRRRPFALVGHDVVTDGKSIIAMAGETFAAPIDMPERPAATVPQWLTDGGSAMPVDRAKLDAWAGADTWWPFSFQCNECDAEETILPPLRISRFGVSAIDRNRLAWMLADCKGDVRVLVTGPTDMIHFLGDGWHAIIMPCRLFGSEAGADFDGWTVAPDGGAR